MCTSTGDEPVHLTPDGEQFVYWHHSEDEENYSAALWVVAAGHQLKGVARASIQAL